jgi:GTP-binding protein Era
MKAGYVALIGRPNVGKSTLLNRLLGQKVAIISDKPQTTRVSILGVKTTSAGQIIFIDNPGIHKPLHTLNRRMMNFVYSALETADLICLLIDATEKYGHGDEFVVETLSKVTTPLFLLINKVDIIKKEKVLPVIERYKDLLPFREIIPISALKGTNLEVLEEQIYKVLPEAEKLFADDMITDRTLRFQLAEIIREKLLERVEEELPFVTAVLVEKIEERQRIKNEPEGVQAGIPVGAEKSASSIGNSEDSDREADIWGASLPGSPVPAAASRGEAQGKRDAASVAKSLRRKRGKERNKVAYLRATIFVEKDNHRKIVIGRHGKVIKEIGIAARREIEDVLDAKVYLDLKVKVKPRWRDSADVLDLIEGQR